MYPLGIAEFSRVKVKRGANEGIRLEKPDSPFDPRPG